MDIRSEEKFICPLCLATRARGSAMLEVCFLWLRFLGSGTVGGGAGSGGGSKAG